MKKKLHILIPVLVITAYSTWDNAVQAMRLGAYDFIPKPFKLSDIRKQVRYHFLSRRTFRWAVGGTVVVGILLLIAFIPLILQFALEFRSWEMFLLAVIGIMVCGSMCSGEMASPAALRSVSIRLREPPGPPGLPLVKRPGRLTQTWPSWSWER